MKRIFTAFMMMLCAVCAASAANYLTFTAEEDSSSFGIVHTGDNNPDVQYSLDDGATWTVLAGGDTVTLAHKGDKALLRGDNPEGFSKSRDQYSTFRMTGKVSASGSVMSLIDGTGLSTEIPNGYCFCRSFRSCTSLTRAPELPATTLTAFCYDAMFLGCTSLTQVPALPATTLANYCYDGMFSGCTSLTQAPELPVVTLVGGCYYSMFSDCASLTQAPALPATTLADSCYMYMFSGCTGLTQAPELPATTLASYCYYSMFKGCASLSQAPALPATTLAHDCYKLMFEGCSSLTQAPELPATTLDGNCYQYMFRGCTSLTKAPELPATTLKYACYESMFSGCANLTEAPELPATTLGAAYCYQSMFSGCTSLTETPDLPAVNLSSSCYHSMFSGCTSLTEAPDLPAVNLSSDCYRSMFSGCTNLAKAPKLPAMEMYRYCYANMFSGCTSLTKAPKLPAVELSTSCYETMFQGCVNLSEINAAHILWGKETSDWVKNVAPTGTFFCSRDLSLEYGASRIPEGWTVKYADYLTLTAEEDGSSFGIVNRNNNPDVQYSLDDGETWNALVEGDAIALAHRGDKALLRGNNPDGFSKADSSYSSFTMTGKIAVSGSVMSLIDGIGETLVVPVDYCFYGLFIDCASLTRVAELPATTLTDYCYASMFSGCANLTQVPDLPAITLATYCYGNMFSGCTSLIQSPRLLASTLADSCYASMFSGCTMLSEIKVSFVVWENTSEWVADVAPTGTFICPKPLALEYGLDRIPEGWTVRFNDYLTFTAEEDGSSFGIVNRSNHPDVQYSLDGGETWNILAEGDSVILVHEGDKALLRGNNPNGFSKKSGVSSYSTESYSSFTMTGKIAASGGVMSLIDGMGIGNVIPVDFCFYGLFSDCASLTQAPELPATMLTEYCYGEMFSGCTGLTETPELPVTDLKTGCYWGMFSGCASLTKAPELPATTLVDFCYRSMFEGCTSLTQAPELPATTLAGGCYNSMFRGCTSLTEAPELPATTLAEHCYYRMFSGCTSLIRAPQISALTMDFRGCIVAMFSGCTNLSEISVAFEEWSNIAYTQEWVANVAPTGTFICPKTLPLEYGISRIPEGWTVKYIEDTVAVETNYLTFTAEEDGSTFGIVNKGGNNPDIQYSLDGGETWTALAAGDTITLAHKGDKALLRGDNPEGFSKDEYSKYSSFTMTGKITASGSVMSLIDGIGETLVIPNDLCNLFSGCASLTQAPELPATTLAEWCYYGMFSGCTSLTEAPELPATTLTYSCYREMFAGCTSLTQAPELPATTLTVGCYEGMFVGCTSLTQAPKLPATTLAEGCYTRMFDGCTSLTQAPELPATILPVGCYKGMFEGCTSLTQAPELPATTLAEDCCASMFSGCTSLTQAPELPATTLAENCYESMFSGCTSLTQAPELPATTLTERCYMSMFSVCTRLSEIHVSFDDWHDDYSTAAWVKNVAPTGTFICPKALALEYGTDRIPEGWTVKLIDDTVAAETNYLTFTAEEDGSTFGIVNKDNNPDVQYSLDGGETWTALAAGDTITLAHKGDKALLKGDNPKGFSNRENYSSFTMTGKVSASGSVMSLIDGIGKTLVVPAGDCFHSLFEGCTSLTQAPELPATTLAEGCYQYMFFGCTSLTEAPELPATTLAEYCYLGMFFGCTSLTQAPKLPATTLLEGCYANMFSGCTNLSEINVSFATWSDYYSSTDVWVTNVAPTGTFICPKGLPLEYGVGRIPEGWTVKYIEDGSGVNTTLADNISVWTDDLTIFVRGAEGEISLYDMSGRIVAVSNSKDEERALCVPSKGVYVVRTNNGTSDVLVR